MIIKDTLEGQEFIIHTANDGEEGLRMFYNIRPDVLVADVMMPRMDGFEMVRRIRQTDKSTPVLFLTARSGINDVVEGFELGANDYLKKPFGMQELIIRIKALLGRAFNGAEKKDHLDSRFEIGNYRFNSLSQVLSYGGVEQILSHRESEILKRLCENRSQVVNSQNILLELWGDDSFFNSRSLHGGGGDRSQLLFQAFHLVGEVTQLGGQTDLLKEKVDAGKQAACHESQQQHDVEGSSRGFGGQTERRKLQHQGGLQGRGVLHEKEHAVPAISVFLKFFVPYKSPQYVKLLYVSWISAFVGIQPTLRQVPPTLSASIRETLAPIWAALMAVTYPPGPAPTTMMLFCPDAVAGCTETTGTTGEIVGTAAASSVGTGATCSPGCPITPITDFTGPDSPSCITICRRTPSSCHQGPVIPMVPCIVRRTYSGL